MNIFTIISALSSFNIDTLAEIFFSFTQSAPFFQYETGKTLLFNFIECQELINKEKTGCFGPTPHDKQKTFTHQ